MADDRLARYNALRDFGATPEPAGTPGRKRGVGLSFLVQKHAATRLHYDLRLEWDGVLLSWAVTKGPSADPSQKRLAVRTEDHPLTYGTFEGTIPKDQYGGGTVMLWDRGIWSPDGDVGAMLAKGDLKFELYGERMRGAWALVRMKPKRGETRENWLLLKKQDAHAGEGPDSLTSAHSVSVASGRSMDEIAAGTAPPRRKRERAAPDFRKPQLAALAESAPEGEGWLHETKYDGYRALAAIGKAGVTLYTRSGLDWTDRFAPLVPAFEALPCDSALIDGEVMARDPGASPFAALQQALSAGAPLDFYAFDLLGLDGESLTALPQIARKDRLRALVKGSAIRFAEHITGNGPLALDAVCRAGGEGIISKRADAPYRGARSRAWLKVKCRNRQEFVIGGFSKSSTRGRPFASLLMGSFEDGAFVYRGRVGTGFDAATLRMLAAAMEPLIRKDSPFAAVPKPARKGATWIEPRLIAEIDLAEFTADGHIRHGSFIALREDRMPKTVKLEKAVEKSETVAGVRISSPGRIMFPRAKLTKLGLAEYYLAAGERLTAIAGGRPLSLVRCPDGMKGECFYQKHARSGFPEGLEQIGVTEKDGDTEPYVSAPGPQGFVAAVQMGTVEFHIWGARNDRLERPDRLVFDLDPDEGMGFGRIKRAAFDLRDRLAGLGLASTALVSGGKGIHVTVILKRTVEWETVRLFARTFAALMSQAEPDRFVATMSKEKRKGKIFIDWLRNDHGATAIAPYSVRARPGAPVAVPVTWDELEGLKAANAFTVVDMVARLAAPCPYLEAAKTPQTLGKGVIAGLEKLGRQGG